MVVRDRDLVEEPFRGASRGSPGDQLAHNDGARLGGLSNSPLNTLDESTFYGGAEKRYTDYSALALHVVQG